MSVQNKIKMDQKPEEKSCQRWDYCYPTLFIPLWMMKLYSLPTIWIYTIFVQGIEYWMNNTTLYRILAFLTFCARDQNKCT